MVEKKYEIGVLKGMYSMKKINITWLKNLLATRKGKIIIGVLLVFCIAAAVIATGFVHHTKLTTNSLNHQEKTRNSSMESSVALETDSGKNSEGYSEEEQSKDTQENQAEEIEGEGLSKTPPGGNKTDTPDNITSLTVSGNRLADENGNTVLLKGISTHGLSWFPEYVNADSFKQLHEQWGINCIRLAMYTAEYNGYCTGDSSNRERLKNLIDDGVTYATQNNMYVIIDWHILSDNNPNMYLDESKAFFEEMSQKYAKQNNVLYEICNEPNGGTSWAQIKSYANEVIPVIRENDSDAVIIVGTPNWSQYVGEAADDPITGYDNIMYALHFYAATHTESLRAAFVSAINQGLPIFVSEFGICDASGNGGIDEYQAEQWVSLMNEYGVSYIAWNLSNKNETSAMISSGCSKTSGWSYEELSDSGKWLYNMFCGETEYSAWESSSDTDIEETDSEDSFVSDNTISDSAVLDNAAYDMQLRNSWVTDGHTYYLYDLTVTNSGSQTVVSWNVSIDFDRQMTLTDYWNGDYELEGTRLLIHSKDYNGTISAGETIGNIGFIVHD